MPRASLLDWLSGSKNGFSPTLTALTPYLSPCPSRSSVAVWKTERLSQIAILIVSTDNIQGTAKKTYQDRSGSST